MTEKLQHERPLLTFRIRPYGRSGFDSKSPNDESHRCSAGNFQVCPCFLQYKAGCIRNLGRAKSRSWQ